MADKKMPVTAVQWWTKDESEMHRAIFEVVTKLHNDQSGRLDRNLRSLLLYGNMQFSGTSSYSYNRMAASPLPENRVKINIVASMCDTVSAIISKMKPRVAFLTEDGDAGLQTEAKKLTTYIGGLFYKNSIYDLHQSGFRDGTIIDIGAVKHYIEDGEIKSERVLGTELYTDAADSLYGDPMSLYQVKYIHKEILKAQYPGNDSAIERSASSIGNRVFASQQLADYVAVIEAWHKPMNKEGLHGKKAIVIEQGTLIADDYKKDYFPFTFFRWSQQPVGFYGQALAERLAGNQIEINKMLRIIQKSFDLGASFKVFLEYGSKVVKEHLNNDIGSIVYYNGTPPQFYVPKTVHEEYFRHLEWLIKNSYEEAGVSQLSATSQKPAGLDSAVAMREYNDIQTERFAIVSQQYEQSYLQTARIYLDLSKDLYESGVDTVVKAPAKKFIQSIKWSEIDLEADAYVMQMFPISSLPHEPAGRLAFVQEMLQGGLIDRDWALELLDFPDTQNYLSLKNASLEDILYTIDQIVNHAKYTPPEPYQNLQLGMTTMQNAYLKAKRNGVAEKNLQMMRDWMVHADAMMKQGQQQAQAGAPGMAEAQGQPQAEQMAAAAPGPQGGLAPAQLIATPRG